MNSEAEVVEVSAKQSNADYWKELWRFRELLYILSWRDIKVRYKQTVIGAAWAVIRPLLTMVVFTFIFGRVAGLNEQSETPYSLLVLVGVLAWQLISTTISESAGSMLGNERLITKVYFPRVLVPVSTMTTCLIDFFIAISLLVVLFVVYGQWPSIFVLFFPLWLFITLAFALGVGLGLSALNVRYRDFRYALPFMLQVGLFLSPVGFSTKAVPEAWQWLYQLNPVVGLIESLRWCSFGQTWQAFPIHSFGVSLVWTVLVFSLGHYYFRKTERTFADII